MVLSSLLLAAEEHVNAQAACEDAPGPEVAKRRRQIKAALEGLTPYALDDLVYDTHGSGPEVQVAAVAKETLEQAEAFAAEHRFNPVSFVAVPDNGLYLSEPFFGPSQMSPALLSERERLFIEQGGPRAKGTLGFEYSEGVWTGEAKVILFNLCGHGHFDLASYERYLSGDLEDYEYPMEAVEAALAGLPTV